MKRLVQLALIPLMVLTMVVSCSEKSLVPGDKVGEMVLLNQCDGVNILDLCSFDELFSGSCQIPVSAGDLWVSAGWGEPTSNELEQAWKDSTWSMTFDDHKVDLTKFGTYDLDIPDPNLGLLKGRVWSFCINNPSIGLHTARYDFQFVHGSRPGKNAQDWTFTIVEASTSNP